LFFPNFSGVLAEVFGLDKHPGSENLAFIPEIRIGKALKKWPIAERTSYACTLRASPVALLYHSIPPLRF
jgi:hypothetical protein